MLPELDEEFAKAVGEGFESLDALRAAHPRGHREGRRRARDNRYHDQILGELVESATIEFPPVMLDARSTACFHDRVGHVEQDEELRALPGVHRPHARAGATKS